MGISLNIDISNIFTDDGAEERTLETVYIFTGSLYTATVGYNTSDSIIEFTKKMNKQNHN